MSKPWQVYLSNIPRIQTHFPTFTKSDSGLPSPLTYIIAMASYSAPPLTSHPSPHTTVRRNVLKQNKHHAHLLKISQRCQLFLSSHTSSHCPSSAHSRPATLVSLLFLHMSRCSHINSSYLTFSPLSNKHSSSYPQESSLTAQRPLLKCHLFREAFPDLCKFASPITFCLFIWAFFIVLIITWLVCLF